jgi:hypothetical protein
VSAPRKKWWDEIYRGHIAVALDFDGTLVYSRKFPAFGELQRGAITAWRAFEKAGLKVIVFTARRHKRPVWKFLLRHKLIPWKVTSAKPKEAYAMVDDRSIRYEGNWAAAFHAAMRQIEEEKRKIKKRERG